MASSSPPRSTAGDHPPSSPTEYKSPLQSPSSYNSTHSFQISPLNKKSPLQSPSGDQNKEFHQSMEQCSSQKSGSRDQNRESNQSKERIPSQKSPYRDQTKEESNRSRKQAASPPLSPLKFKSSPSIKIQPPPLSTLALSEASPSPLTVSNRVISHSNRSPNFDEEAVESPLRIVTLDQRDRVSDQEVTGRRNGGESRVVPEAAVWKAETRWAVVGLRILAAVFCVVSFSVMAADRTQGWNGDVYSRHHEYVYCLTVNAITFAYSSLQLYQEMHHVLTSKHLIPRPHAYYLDLILDQILAYLLMSASSAAASCNDIWVTRFGGDEFTRKISGSVAMSFLAFVSLALSSFISTYALVSWIS